MKPETIIGIVICLLVVCCLFTHRRVIRALIKHELMPKAPKMALLGEKRKQKSLRRK